MNEFVRAEKIRLVFSGSHYFETLGTLIASAKESIRIHTYIFDCDETGNAVAEQLIGAAQRGVKVQVLADAFGSNALPGRFIRRIRDCGVAFRLFSPLFSTESIYLGRRLHQKIVVVDKHKALIGGINIADKYKGTKEEEAWLDYAALVEGPCCEYLDTLCDEMYKKRRRKKRADVVPSWNGEGPLVRFRQNDWIKLRNEIHKSYREYLTAAGRSVTIVAGYFLPGPFFLKVLKRAIARGVKVRIITAGRTDVLLFLNAERHLYGHLLDLGTEIYEWNNSVMHGKAVIVDDEWCTLGSYNLNYLSHYRSIELNVDIRDRKFVGEFTSHLDEIISEKCVRINLEDFTKKTGGFSKLVRAGAYHILRVLMNILIPRARKKL